MGWGGGGSNSIYMYIAVLAIESGIHNNIIAVCWFCHVSVRPEVLWPDPSQNKGIPLRTGPLR